MLPGPQRIVCLTEETTEWLYRLGQEARIVGISGYTVRPRRAREEKPKVSGFTTARLDKILAVKPDLVLGYCDLQADMVHRASLALARVVFAVRPQREIARPAPHMGKFAAHPVRRAKAQVPAQQVFKQPNRTVELADGEVHVFDESGRCGVILYDKSFA